ncbi:hypothetical protein [Oleomonas cavernae]|uniref:hypothetical protein n=1 Tax=Oleomonas cavernae TaxID=2320859 RepID=UPI0011C44A3D|nr:hypothetical protein [Oleomonas cavernae]
MNDSGESDPILPDSVTTHESAEEYLSQLSVLDETKDRHGFINARDKFPGLKLIKSSKASDAAKKLSVPYALAINFHPIFRRGSSIPEGYERDVAGIFVAELDAQKTRRLAMSMEAGGRVVDLTNPLGLLRKESQRLVILKLPSSLAEAVNLQPISKISKALKGLTGT